MFIFIKIKTMRKYFLLLASLLSFSMITNAQKVVKVKNGKELLNAIAPNTTIELAEGDYELPSGIINEKKPEIEVTVTDSAGNKSTEYRTNYISAPVNTQYVKFSDNGDGYAVDRVANLTIIGKGKTRSHIFIKNQEVPAIFFDSCSDLTLDNLKIGHLPKGKIAVGCGGYEAPVIKLSDATNVSINNCGLYGSGNWGITGYDIKNLSVTNSIIYDCNVGLLHISRGENLKFTNTKFNNNTTGSYAKDNWLTLSEPKDVVFDKCEFMNNTYAKAIDPPAQNLYSEKQAFVAVSLTLDDNDKEIPATVLFKNCKFLNNKYGVLCNEKNVLKFIGSKPL
jgi:hypothetical protein